MTAAVLVVEKRVASLEGKQYRNEIKLKQLDVRLDSTDQVLAASTRWKKIDGKLE